MSKLVPLVCVLIVACDAAKILFVIPTPSISHQVPFRPIIMELVKRGHEVTSITTDAIFPNGGAPANLTEIDLHDLSYKAWRDDLYSEEFTKLTSDRILHQVKILFASAARILELQTQTPEIQHILFNDTVHFDLLVLEEWVRSTLLFSHVFKNVPVIIASSFGAVTNIYESMGAPIYPRILYPCIFRQKYNNLSVWDKMTELYKRYILDGHIRDQDVVDNAMMKKLLGPDTPTLKELEKNVDMLFLNDHHLWDLNRPVPPSVLYMGGGMHLKPEEELPKELKQYLDSSKHGVVYVSYGTNVNPAEFPPETIQTLIRAFSKLPYDVLWKWNEDELPGKTENIRISKWLPQSDLLRHPKIKVFITQGGLQSTDEAISAGVPLIGMPMLGDQWFNVEHYVQHKIGVRVDMETVSEEKMLTAINTVIDDKIYRKNMKHFRAVMHDQPQPALEKTIWWMEHLLRHGNGKHLRAPAANMTWAEYLDLELVAVVASIVLAVIAAVVVALVVAVRALKNTLGGKSKKIKKK